MDTTTVILISNNHMRRIQLESHWKAAGITMLPTSSRLKPDYIALDLQQPGAFVTLKETKRHYPFVPLVAFGPLGQAALFQQAKKAGADFAVTNNVISDWLIELIKP